MNTHIHTKTTGTHCGFHLTVGESATDGLVRDAPLPFVRLLVGAGADQCGCFWDLRIHAVEFPVQAPWPQQFLQQRVRILLLKYYKQLNTHLIITSQLLCHHCMNSSIHTYHLTTAMPSLYEQLNTHLPPHNCYAITVWTAQYTLTTSQLLCHHCMNSSLQRPLFCCSTLKKQKNKNN